MLSSSVKYFTEHYYFGKNRKLADFKQLNSTNENTLSRMFENIFELLLITMVAE